MREIVEKGKEVWTTSESKRKTASLYPRPVSIKSSSSTNCSELLRIDDLKVQTPLHRPSRVCPQQRPQCSIDTVEQAVSSGKFSVYEGGDLNEFIGSDVFAPKRVSEVCLVNDHYILVKIPESSKPQRSSASEEQAKTTQRNAKFTRYLRCGNTRSCRIGPTSETLGSASGGSTTASWSTNGCVQEIFKSRTTIQGNLKVFQSAAFAETGKAEQNNEEPVTSPLRRSPAARVPLQTSLNYRVNLESYGRLETSQGDGITHNTRKPNLPRPRRPFGSSLRGFLKSFSNRPNTILTSPKIKKKINAVVYKTYFVSWIKAGRKSSCSQCRDAKVSLRRTQSSIF